MAPLRAAALLAGACLAGAFDALARQLDDPEGPGHDRKVRSDRRPRSPSKPGKGKKKYGVAKCPEEKPDNPFAAHASRQFNGSYTFTHFEGDMQAIYQKMGLPWELRMLAKELNYGVDITGERVTHQDNFMRISSLVNLNHKYYVLGSNDYMVGEGKNTGFGYSICGNWVRNGTELLVRIEEAANSPFAGVVALPVIRRFWAEDGISQVVEATVDDVVVPLTMTPRSKHRGDSLPMPVIPPELLPDGTIKPVDASAAKTLTKAQALSFAGMMSMGLLPPFIPMQLVDFAEAED